MNMMPPDKIANTGIVTGFFVWFMAHIGAINEVLQFFLLVASLVGVYFAVQYHKSNTPKR